MPFGRAKVLCTYHPSYLLRNPAAKKDVWQDMQFLMSEAVRELTRYRRAARARVSTRLSSIEQYVQPP